MKKGLVESIYLVSGMPHILLASEKSKGWDSLKSSYAQIEEEIARSDADLILYFSTQWMSVLGYMFQGDPAPEWEHVDPNWYDFGSMKYQFRVDCDFATKYAQEVHRLGHNTKVVNYKGFPIDTGTIVVQKLLNPRNEKLAGMVSCNIYAEKVEVTSVGRAALRALETSGKRAIVVLVSNLSNRFEITEIDPRLDKISSLKDDEWNRKILELLAEGRLEDVSQTAREFSRQANADMGFRGIWWLSGLCGQTNSFSGRVFDYQPVWGTGAALVGLYPTHPILPLPEDEDVDSEEGSQAALVSEMVDSRHVQVNESLMMDPHSSKAPEPVGAYPHARRYGNLLFLSGVGPRKRGTKEIPGVQMDEFGNVREYDVVAQTHSVIDNVKVILEEAGSSLDKILDVQIFLADMKRDFPLFNRVYGERLGSYGATRTTVEVGALPTPIAVEFKVIAQP